MHQKSVKAAQLHFQYITAKTLHDRTSGFYDLIKELRSQIFCYNGSIWTLGTEFSDEEHDEQCSNLVAFLGDAPVCTARLFIVEKAMNIPTVIIDRFGVVQRYRGMGLGRLSLYDILDHVSKVLQNQGRTVNIELKVPLMEGSVALVNKLQQELGFVSWRGSVG